ncbi:organic cation/carnitine transporter 7-like [Dorcoceras hygrometricum]|uniref:Organic cation/carnitine transporter 7-like n=1 Tax=Dorcoceras hygrometricum TaxID=472368 RepID=A0A2Z6ZYB4_9LAMI|nr:organic cation/carnitine transporter 7-like [Dorcoceras hygrometricum]
MAIGSIATLDLPMVVDLIGINGLKGPYCTLTTTNWFLQTLSVIPRGSWGDVSRCFTMIRWAAVPPLSQRAAAASSPEFVPAKFDEENPSAQISSALLVQADEGT